MKCHFLLTSGQIDDKSCGYVAECIELVRLTKIHHIPDQSLLVCYFTMKFEMIETEAVFAKPVVFESKLTLCPLEEDSLRYIRLCNVFSLG
jgi:hypothetical protein